MSASTLGMPAPDVTVGCTDDAVTIDVTDDGSRQPANADPRRWAWAGRDAREGGDVRR